MDNYTLNNAGNGTHQIISRYIPSGSVVLDIGCNKGYLRDLVPSGVFYGIDYSDNDLEIARKKYAKVFKIDLNSSWGNFDAGVKFDVLVFSDILEHLLRPQETLAYFADRYLKDNGMVIISLPNVAHLFIRLNLLIGRFDYTDAGILDKSHLHLYTLKTARQLIKAASLSIIKEEFSSNRLGGLIRGVPFLATLCGFNLIFICKKISNQH